MTNEIKYQNPFVGPRPFEQDDKNLFFGRNREVRELLSLVTARKEVVFYARSGAGKTSLLNAGLIPLMEDEGFEVFPKARVKGLIPKIINPKEITNIYVFNSLMSWAKKGEADPKKFAKKSISAFLNEQSHSTDKQGFPALRVIIFDQFEELFTSYYERWKERKEFFIQLADALEQDSLLRVVFVMREEYIAQLDPYAPLLPKKLRTRFYLESLREKAALSAVKEPLQHTDRRITEDAAEELVSKLLEVLQETPEGKITRKGEFVEPVQLQIVCQKLWEKWKNLPPDVKEITKDRIESIIDVNQALEEFYEGAISETVLNKSITEEELRGFFEDHLITSAGTRGTVFQEQEETGGIPNEAVSMLVDLHIIRREIRGGGKWLELTHDKFIKPIQKSNKKWRINYDSWYEEQGIFNTVINTLKSLKDKQMIILWSAILLLTLSGGGDFDALLGDNWSLYLFPGISWHHQLLIFITGCIFLVGIPCCIIIFRFKERLSQYGLGWPKNKIKSGLFAIILLFVFAFLPHYFATFDPVIQAEYPLFGDSIQRGDFGGFFIYQLVYFSFFFAIEFLFRGYLLFGLYRMKNIEISDKGKDVKVSSRTFGLYAIFIQMLFYTIWTQNKTNIEIFLAIPWSVIAAAVALKMRSIWPIAIAHWLPKVFLDTVLWLR